MSFVHATIASSPIFAAMRWRTRNHGRVLMYHRIVRDDRDGSAMGLLGGAITLSAFERQLDFLNRYYRVVPLIDLLQRRDATAGCVALTFDDGYADNLWHALPALAARGMCATLFATVGFLDTVGGLWWERLARWIEAKGPETLHLEDQSFTFDGSYKAQYRAVRDWLAELPEQRRDSLLVEAPAHPDDRFLTADELRSWSAQGMSVGAHTLGHPRLSALGRAQQRREMDKTALEQVLKEPVDLFAYPFGQRGDFDAVSLEEARAGGYRAAFAAFHGFLDERTSTYAIPRIRARQDFGRFRLDLVRAGSMA
jgi:peptidoglycan/xylan/chitin deacetylase (PgdA/CDA1 family)